MANDYAGNAAFLQSLADGLTPDPLMTVAEWADNYRILSGRAAAEAGRYRTSRTPYMREIMENLSPSSPVERVVFMKAAQTGATEAGNNFIGFVIHQAPGPILAVQPTVELAKRNSQQRIDPLIDDSEALRKIVAPARSRDSGNTVLAKRFPGGQLVLTGANSATGLRSMPARYVFLDEVDAYPGDVDGEGDPIALAEARTATFGHRKKLFLVSTPTIKGLSRIEREYEASDQRRYFVPCPQCGAMQWLQFERLRWRRGSPRPHTTIARPVTRKSPSPPRPRCLRRANGARQPKEMILGPADTTSRHSIRPWAGPAGPVLPAVGKMLKPMTRP